MTERVYHLLKSSFFRSLVDANPTSVYSEELQEIFKTFDLVDVGRMTDDMLKYLEQVRHVVLTFELVEGLIKH